MKRLKSKKLSFILAGAITVSCIFIFTYYNKYISNKPNIILITIDSLRPDHLSCYGYERNTSPNIDDLARKGVRFLNSFSTSCSTPHALPALLTGKYLGIFSIDILLQPYENILDKKFVMLAEHLRSFGYYTAAFLNNGHLRSGTGFEQGFEVYIVDCETPGANKLTDKVIKFLNSYSRNKPLFIWINYVDPHIPYSAPKDYFQTFENDRLYKENDKILKLHPGGAVTPFLSEGFIPRAVFQENKYSLNYYIAGYDAEILYTDYHLARLFKKIKDIEDNTLIILTANNGESLGEHNIYFHHEKITDDILRIPLIIKDTRFFKGGKKISEVVSSVDIVPTILNRISPVWYFFNKHKFDGLDLRKISEKKDIKRKYIYSYFPRINIIRDVNKNIKYIKYILFPIEEALYFLPDENNNLAGNASLEISSIRKELEENLNIWLNDYPIRCDINSKIVTIDEKIKEDLRSLGYFDIEQ